MIKEEKYQKIENFFKKDLEIKQILNAIIPTETDFYNEESKINYADKLIKEINKIAFLIQQIINDFNIPDHIKETFATKIKQIEQNINGSEFYNTLNQGLLKTLQYIKSNISDLRPEFVDSVRKGFKGYCLFYGENVENPITINEFLHYIHSYIINNEKFYEDIPEIKSKKENEADEWEGIFLRGKIDKLGEKLFDEILKNNINSDRIDILSLTDKILIMARDLGHATVLEIDTTDKEKIFVRYFIPKNNNTNMTANLKGINVNKPEFAVGDFLTNKENFSNDIITLMKGIATDLDMEINNNYQ